VNVTRQRHVVSPAMKLAFPGVRKVKIVSNFRTGSRHSGR
jgi:hypothetical protein